MHRGTIPWLKSHLDSIRIKKNTWRGLDLRTKPHDFDPNFTLDIIWYIHSHRKGNRVIVVVIREWVHRHNQDGRSSHLTVVGPLWVPCRRRRTRPQGCARQRYDLWGPSLSCRSSPTTGCHWCSREEERRKSTGSKEQRKEQERSTTERSVTYYQADIGAPPAKCYGWGRRSELGFWPPPAFPLYICSATVPSQSSPSD